MSIANDLTAIATSLSGILGDINTALDAKGVSTGAETLDEVPDKIGDISQSGGTVTVTVITSNPVTSSSTSNTVLASGPLPVTTGQTLVGVWITDQNVTPDNNEIVYAVLFCDGSGICVYGDICGPISTFTMSKTGETIVTIELPSAFKFGGSYKVYPIISTVS